MQEQIRNKVLQPSTRAFLAESRRTPNLLCWIGCTVMCTPDGPISTLALAPESIL
jgi:hypothetical protein